MTFSVRRTRPDDGSPELRIHHRWVADNYDVGRVLLQRGVAFANARNRFQPLLGDGGPLPTPDFVAHTPCRSAPSLLRSGTGNAGHGHLGLVTRLGPKRTVRR